ncbi:MAG: RlmE family RNA methyltransferase [Rickettsiaceae bacterium]|nr:RlmE family RNA methyltransferase [Rickettsiaceae bacterium]
MTMNSSGYRSSFVRVKTAKKRKTSSTMWLQRQLNDPYVAKAKLDGYRSRAAYKLLEIQEKFGLFKRGKNVVDLGAAPGGWSQIAANLIGSDNKDAQNILVAIDLLAMEEIPGVISVQKDFYDPSTKQWIIENLNGKLADIVMSDMAGNTTGHSQTDHIRIMALCEDVFHFAMNILSPGGAFIAKVFRGGAENELLNLVKQNFDITRHFKPKSSRKESSEFYLIAIGKK